MMKDVRIEAINPSTFQTIFLTSSEGIVNADFLPVH
jgi:hypothetical protein